MHHLKEPLDTWSLDTLPLDSSPSDTLPTQICLGPWFCVRLLLALLSISTSVNPMFGPVFLAHTLPPNPPSKMALAKLPYTGMNYTTDIDRKRRAWSMVPQLGDLQIGERLVTSFSQGTLRLSHPLLFSEAAKQSFDGHYLGASILGEILPSDKVSRHPP